jgi:hypothetical protein
VAAQLVASRVVFCSTELVGDVSGNYASVNDFISISVT